MPNHCHQTNKRKTEAFALFFFTNPPLPPPPLPAHPSPKKQGHTIHTFWHHFTHTTKNINAKKYPQKSDSFINYNSKRNPSTAAGKETTATNNKQQDAVTEVHCEGRQVGRRRTAGTLGVFVRVCKGHAQGSDGKSSKIVAVRRSRTWHRSPLRSAIGKQRSASNRQVFKKNHNTALLLTPPFFPPPPCF